MTMRALIVDDEPLSRERIRMLLRAHPEVHIVDECGDGSSAVTLIHQLKPDVVFLDVQMPELDGFDVLEQINSAVMPAVIFVTAYDSYAIRAFDVNAVDYLLKPVDPARLTVALERARSGVGREGTTEQLLSAVEAFKRPRYRTRVVVRDQKGAFFLPVEKIEWLEAADNYVRLHANGTSYLVRDTLKAMEATLDPERFVRVHRSAIVNLDRIDRVEPWSRGEYAILLRDGKRLTSSRAYGGAFRALLDQ
jgi:two-component system, LytTR family, response regulator